MRVFALFLLTCCATMAQSTATEEARIERSGDMATLVVHAIVPMDAVATLLESQFGIAAGAEDPLLKFKGDLMDLSLEEPRIRPGYMVPARWGFETKFAVKADGSPKDVHALLNIIVETANKHSQFAYRLDECADGFSLAPARDGGERVVDVTPLFNRRVTIRLDECAGAFSFVPTRARDAEGRVVDVTPLLDRRVTIPMGSRQIRESAELMAEELGKQVGLGVSCCQTSVNGIPWVWTPSNSAPMTNGRVMC